MLPMKVLAITLLCFITSAQATEYERKSSFDTIPAGEVANYLEPGDKIKQKSWALLTGTIYKDYEFDLFDIHSRLWMTNSENPRYQNIAHKLNFGGLYLERWDLCITDGKARVCDGDWTHYKLSNSETAYGSVQGFQVGQREGREQRLLIYLSSPYSRYVDIPMSEFKSMERMNRH